MLTNEEIVRFREEGYLAFSGVLGDDRVAFYRSVFDGMVEEARKLTDGVPHWSLELDSEGKPIEGFLHKVQGVCVVEPRILQLASEPAILDRVEALVGPNIDLFGTKFFPKLPGGGSSVHWHQDNFYFGTISDHILSCATYLEDSDEGNGCLQVVPGSHRSGEIAEHERRLNAHGSWTRVDKAKAVSVVVPAGSFVVFSANLLHGALDNVSDRSRYSTAWHYVPAGFVSDKFVKGEYEDRHTVRGS